VVFSLDCAFAVRPVLCECWSMGLDHEAKSIPEASLVLISAIVSFSDTSSSCSSFVFPLHDWSLRLQTSLPAHILCWLSQCCHTGQEIQSALSNLINHLGSKGRLLVLKQRNDLSTFFSGTIFAFPEGNINTCCKTAVKYIHWMDIIVLT